MTTPGNDPFSGTNTRDLLQHVVSPKIVSDGSSGYTVKTDLINIDDAYITDTLTANSVTISGNYNPTTPTTVTINSGYSSSQTTEVQNAPVTRYVKRGTTPGSATSFQIFNIGLFITPGLVFHWVYRDEDGNVAWGFVSKNGGNAVATLQVGGSDMSGTSTSGGVTITIDAVTQTDGIKITTNNTNKTYSLTAMEMNVV
jgi:hypothetical protein